MRYNVPLIPQTTNMSCWAASIAMILGWRDNASYSDALLAANYGGTNYAPMMLSGLDPNDRYILQRNGFTLEAPQCYTLRGVKQLLQHYGPLWVATAAPSPHIRVVTGIDGHFVLVNDPAPVGSGSSYRVSFEHFFGQMETLGSQEIKEKNPVYLAHL